MTVKRTPLSDGNFCTTLRRDDCVIALTNPLDSAPHYIVRPKHRNRAVSAYSGAYTLRPTQAFQTQSYRLKDFLLSW